MLGWYGHGRHGSWLALGVGGRYSTEVASTVMQMPVRPAAYVMSWMYGCARETGRARSWLALVLKPYCRRPSFQGRAKSMVKSPWMAPPPLSPSPPAHPVGSMMVAEREGDGGGDSKPRTKSSGLTSSAIVPSSRGVITTLSRGFAFDPFWCVPLAASAPRPHRAHSSPQGGCTIVRATPRQGRCAVARATRANLATRGCAVGRKRRRA